MSSPAAIFPVIPINRESVVPLQNQVYEGYRSSILCGDLRAGQRIPSSREFASFSGLSRFPVLHAYAQLIAEGYFDSKVGAGTFVASSLPEQLMSVNLDASFDEGVKHGLRPVSRRMDLYPRFEDSAFLHGWGSFGVHQPAFDQFPFGIWSSLVARHSNNPCASSIHNVNPFGSERFREAICGYLRTSRAVKCKPSQIMISTSARSYSAGHF
jgi:GntR family transcriptional regulator/MocR family aminotransferase